ncbi:MAG: hypothetical protein V1875_03225 [Candidatus Altiarchaeota archaeon]
MNAVLIGMAGSGKSFIGTKQAARGGKSPDDAFRERRIVNRKYADITFGISGDTNPDRHAEKIATTTREKWTTG